jgi:flavin reductase (DIM6/NTAB) family NADH-FMN oxidoreductase RutF
MTPMAGAPAVDADAFRKAMARWPTGVSVVTTHADGADAGLTVNAFLSISLRPPLVLVSLTLDADSTPLLDRSHRFVVNVLSAEQQPLSERFAQPIPSMGKFVGLPTLRGLGGCRLLEGALLQLECRVRSAQTVEDHRLFVGEVERVNLGQDGAPLLFFRSRYALPGPDGGLRLPGPGP